MLRKMAMVAVVALPGLVLGGAAVRSLPSPSAIGWPVTLPDDAALIANWRAHRSTFAQLVAMLRQDERLQRLGETWIEPADPVDAGLTPERLAVYRRLMRDAGLVGVARHGARFEFTAFASGLAVSGAAKGYTFGALPLPADEMSGDLDTDGAGPRRMLLYRKFAPGWWLCLERS